MSIDGADMGVIPTRALETILGGVESPKDTECLSKQEMLSKIMAMPDDYKQAATNYDTCTFWLAKQFIALRKMGIDGSAHDMYEKMKKRCGENDYDFTGFMVGWANNVSLWLSDRPSSDNPAIINIQVNEKS